MKKKIDQDEWAGYSFRVECWPGLGLRAIYGGIGSGEGSALGKQWMYEGMGWQSHKIALKIGAHAAFCRNQNHEDEILATIDQASQESDDDDNDVRLGQEILAGHGQRGSEVGPE